MAHAADNETFNELDPHGFEGHGHHASHVIVGPFTLRTVLAFLLFFTLLTVALAQLETAIMGWFNIELPWWVNVAVAMSIAVVKALMVMGYFMQLKYDNPINTVLMLFTFGALAIFLFFTGLDLFNRGAIDPQKQTQIIAGGTGSGVTANANQPVTAAARERMIDFLATVEFAKAQSAALSTSKPAIARVYAEVAAELPKVGRETEGGHRKWVVDLGKERLGDETPDFMDFKSQVEGTFSEPSLVAAQMIFARIEAEMTGHGHSEAHAAPEVSNPNRTLRRVGATGALVETEVGHDPHAGQGEHAPATKAAH